MIQVDVLFSNQINRETLNVALNRSICVVIDVIRATSTISTMLAGGADRVLVAKDKKQALALKKKNSRFILCGEEGGLPPAGFDFGNSPLEISKKSMAKKVAIIKTTNGTVSFFRAKSAPAAYVLSLLNLNYCIDLVCNKLKKKPGGLLFLCSGEEGRIAYDDVYVAGLAIKQILTKGLAAQFSDSSKIALGVALSEPNAIGALEKSISAKLLRGAGLGEDIAFCADIDKYSTGGMLKMKKDQLYIVPA